jgi:hypothetical protein
VISAAANASMYADTTHSSWVALAPRSPRIVGSATFTIVTSRYLASLPPGQFPNLTALAGHFSAVDPDERFELLLDIFVDGLAQRAAAR